MWLGKLTTLEMTPLGWLGPKISTHKKKKSSSTPPLQILCWLLGHKIEGKHIVMQPQNKFISSDK